MIAPFYAKKGDNKEAKDNNIHYFLVPIAILRSRKNWPKSSRLKTFAGIVSTCVSVLSGTFWPIISGFVVMACLTLLFPSVPILLLIRLSVVDEDKKDEESEDEEEAEAEYHRAKEHILSSSGDYSPTRHTTTDAGVEQQLVNITIGCSKLCGIMTISPVFSLLVMLTISPVGYLLLMSLLSHSFHYSPAVLLSHSQRCCFVIAIDPVGHVPRALLPCRLHRRVVCPLPKRYLWCCYSIGTGW